MNGKLFYLGYNRGWKMAAAYATGTRRQRGEIRQRLAILSDSFSSFARGVWSGFRDLAEQRSEAIRSGRAPRTINPFRLSRLLDRV
jgi:hypothetical protein